MANNTVTQTIKLNVEPYTGPLNKLRTESKSVHTEVQTDLLRNSAAHKQNEDQVKKWGSTVTAELVKYKNSALENLSAGAKAMTLGFGGKAINKATNDAIALAFSFSKAFSEIRSMGKGSEADLASWEKSIRSISEKTGAHMDSMGVAFRNFAQSVKDPGQLMGVMASIGKAAAMGDGDATRVQGTVMKSLQVQGKDINTENVDDMLHSADVLRRHGNGMGSIEDSLDSMGGMDQNAVRRAGLSSRDLANSVSALTQAGGGKEQGMAGMTGLLNLFDDKKEKLAQFEAIAGGVTNGNGQLDLHKLKGKYSHLAEAGGGGDDGAKRMLGLAGLSGQDLEGILAAMKNADKLGEELDSAAKDTTTFAKSAEEGADNLGVAYEKFKSGLVNGVTDILGGFRDPIKKFLKGDFGGALGSTPGAMGHALNGIISHPGLAVGTLATVMGGGALIGKLMGGGGGGGVVGGLMNKVLGKGQQHVWVDNAAEIQGIGMSALRGGGMGGLGEAAGGMGFMQKAGMVGMAAGVGIAIGSAADEFATEHASTNKYGQKANIFEKGLAKVIPEWMGGMNAKDYHDSYDEAPQKVVVEIHSKDPAFSGVPKSTDLNRNASGH